MHLTFAQSVEREPAATLRARFVLSGETFMRALRVFCSTLSILLMLAGAGCGRPITTITQTFPDIITYYWDKATTPGSGLLRCAQQATHLARYVQ